MRRDRGPAAALRCCVAALAAVVLFGSASVDLRAEEAVFTPPPRKIDDITALLDKAEIADKDEYQRLLAKAREAPPAGASKAELAQF